MKNKQKKERTQPASKSSHCQNDNDILHQNSDFVKLGATAKKNKKSQISDIVAHLRKYKTITSNDAIRRYGATRLSGIIFLLKERGFGINTEIAYGKNRYGNMAHYAIYHLVKDIEEVDD